MTMAFEKKEAGVWLTRTERDLLRKFLFMQLYRASGFHKRFCHDSPEDYNENDKVLFREYMAEHGYKRPMDVWLHSIKTIIQLKMDPEKKWMTELHERMYPGDAVWFIGHVQFYYTAICTPSHADQEFILTSNGFGVFEGSNRFVRDYDTGEVGCAGHTPLHYFAPVSPKLMIILRARTFPEVIKHADDEARALWEEQRRLALGVTIGYDGLLADLPVEMPENNYTTVGTDGRLYGSDGEYWRPRSDHRFCLRLFEIGSEHVNRINAILLDNCWGVDPSTAVVFDSHEAFVKTLEWYLTAPCDIGKVIQGVGADVRESALMKLEALSRSLGSQKTTEWVKRREPTMHNYEGYVQSYIDRYRALHKMAAKSEDGGGEALEETIPPEPGSAHHIYLNLLGGTNETLPQDMDQARRMWTLRAFIDVASRGIDDEIRRRNRSLLDDAYMRCPPRRVWLYVKTCRLMAAMASMQVSKFNPDLFWNWGPEDDIAQEYNQKSDDPCMLNMEMYTTVVFEAGLGATISLSWMW